MLIKMLKTQFWTRFSLESGCVFIMFKSEFILRCCKNGLGL